MRLPPCPFRFIHRIHLIAMASCAQTIYVVRHGERLDYVDARWRRANAERGYDSPLSEDGKRQATEFGKQLKRKRQQIECFVSSPFLRCLQTATCMAKVLGHHSMGVSNGLCELLNRSCHMTKKPTFPSPHLDLEDLSVNSSGLDSPLPDYPEDQIHAYHRYITEFNGLSDKRWPTNLVLVTHGYGVQAALTLALSDKEPYNIEFCGYVALKRQTKGGKWTLVESEGVDY